MSEDPMEPWGCPWCGEEPPDGFNDRPDGMRSLMAFDAWLEEHVAECEPYLNEGRK